MAQQSMYPPAYLEPIGEGIADLLAGILPLEKVKQ